jgi:hypothetical protein
MTIKIIDEIFSVCKVLDYKCIDLATPFVFTGSTDEEKSIVCPVRLVPENTVISKVLANGGIGIFAISTFNTDYILTKSENFERAIGLLQSAGYAIK